jgi:hypothetical protein
MVKSIRDCFVTQNSWNRGHRIQISGHEGVLGPTGSGPPISDHTVLEFRL